MNALTIPADPDALPFLPLIYLAWADGDLADEELHEIAGLILATPAIRGDTRDALEHWLKPDRPPTPRALAGLLAHLRAKAVDIPAENRRTLAQLGEALASDGASEETRTALAAVEEALGVNGSEAARDLLPLELPRPPEGAQPAVDVAALTRLLDGEHHVFREKIRRLLTRPEFAPELGLSKEAYREKTLERCRILAAEGLGALSYPREYGGEQDMQRFAVAFETLAFCDISMTIKFGVQFGLFGGAVRMLGTERHHRSYLQQIGTLELPGCFAMTETGHGSNVYDLETEARYDPEAQEFVVFTPNEAARKDYIGNAACHGRLAVVFAQLVVGDQRHGVHALLVPIRNADGTTAKGVRIEDCGEKLGLNGVDNGRLWFDDVRVPRENLLNRFADVTLDGDYHSDIASPSKRFFTMIGALVAGRVSVALASLSAMKVGLATAVRYGDQRRQFGAAGEAEVRLLDYRTHQRRLLPPLAAAYALDFSLKDLTRRFVGRTEENSREVEALAAGLKAYATWRNIEALQTCRECCGGWGYLAENRFTALKADTDIFCTFEGDNTVLMQLAAKSLLSEYRRQFEDARPFTMLRYLTGRAADAAGEPSPVVARQTDSEHLRDTEFHLDAFRYREGRLLDSVARRLRSRISGGMDSFHAFTDCQDHLVAAAHAHVERIVVERFVEGVASCDDPCVQEILAKLEALFALSRLEEDRAWFLESGAFSAAKSRAVRAEVNALCTELRPVAVDLVNAFSVPQ